jgi:fos-like antigen, invertebrate
MRQQQNQQQMIQQQPTVIPTFLNEMDPNSMDNSMDSSSMSESSWQTPTQDNFDDSNQATKRRGAHTSPGSSSETSNQPKPPRRNAGGRKPSKQSNLSPEEEMKRKVRRERNKQAAARCRKRREDHTCDLQGKVDEMEEAKRQLTAEIQTMSQLKDELYELIEEHKRLNKCYMADRSSPNDIKPVLTQNVTITSSSSPITPTATTTTE